MSKTPAPTSVVEQTDQGAKPVLTRLGWLQFALLALILIVGMLALNIQQMLSSNALSRQQREMAVQSADEQRRENQLTSYINAMSDLLVHDKLLDSKPGDPARRVADSRTSEVLRALDAERKAAVMRYLYTTQLISNDRQIISTYELDLRGAHLSGIDLRDTYLSGADLRGADLRKANLTYVTLNFANLSGADLRGTDLQSSDMHNANISGANLAGANLKDVVGLSNEQLARAQSLTGTIMPDGSKHP